MKISRRQAIFGSIAAAFAGPGLVASVEAAELRAEMEPLIKWFNEHQHQVCVGGPTSPPPRYVSGKAKFEVTFKTITIPRFQVEKDPNCMGWKLEEIIHGERKV